MTNQHDDTTRTDPEWKEGIEGNTGQHSSEPSKTRAGSVDVAGLIRAAMTALDPLVDEVPPQFANRLNDIGTGLQEALDGLQAQRGGVTHVQADEGSAYDYVQGVISSFDRDPPTTEFQRGFLNCADVIMREAFVPRDGGGRAHVAVAALRQQLKTMAQIRRQDGAVGHALIADRAALCIGNLINHVTRLLPPGTFVMFHGMYHQVHHVAAFDDGALMVTAQEVRADKLATVTGPLALFHVIGHEGDCLSWQPVEPQDRFTASAFEPPRITLVPKSSGVPGDAVEPPPLCGS